MVRVTYDLRQLSTPALLTVFFTLHDFTIDRSGNGGQYRSIILLDPLAANLTTQKRAVDDAVKRLTEAGHVPATEIQYSANFYPAENRHQQYCSTRGIAPKRRASAAIRQILTF